MGDLFLAIQEKGYNPELAICTPEPNNDRYIIVAIRGRYVGKYDTFKRKWA